MSQTKFKSTCPDCGVQRVREPLPGSCPCCFGVIKATDGFKSITVYTCTNEKCKRVCSEDFLSGFWSGWKTNNEYQIERISYEVLQLKKDLTEITKGHSNDTEN